MEGNPVSSCQGVFKSFVGGDSGVEMHTAIIPCVLALYSLFHCLFKRIYVLLYVSFYLFLFCMQFGLCQREHMVFGLLRLDYFTKHNDLHL